MHKLNYMIKCGKVTVRNDHKPLFEIVKGTAEDHNTMAADRFWHCTSEILETHQHPEIEYKKFSLNVISDSLSRLRKWENYQHNIPLHKTEPIILKNKAEVNMVITCAKSSKKEKLTPKLDNLQIMVRDTFKTWDKHNLIISIDKFLESLDPAKLRELQDTDKSIINVKNSTKQSVIAHNKNILRIKVVHRCNTLEAIILPKVLTPWIITYTHEFCWHQGRDYCYYKKTTYFWNGMKNDICQTISNCKMYKMESPNMAK